MEVKNRKSFNSLVKSLTLEVIGEEELEETTATGNVAGYNTPFAFTGGKKKKKKYKDNTYRKKLGEALDNKDLDKIKKLIRSVVGDILRDIWLKRATWK